MKSGKTKAIISSLAIILFLIVSIPLAWNGLKHRHLKNMEQFENATGLLNADLVFVYGTSGGAMDDAMMGSTGEIVHVGIIEVEKDSVYVIDASGQGVARRTLQAFLQHQKHSDGKLPHMIVKRLQDRSNVDQFIKNAKEKIGLAYDWYYLENNDQYYCSELVYDCYIRDGEHVFEAKPMNFRNEDGTLSPFWIELYNKLGVDVPEGMPGTNPNDMSKADILISVDVSIEDYQ